MHDLETWKYVFSIFDRRDIKSKIEKKDINQYKSIDELKSIVLPLVQQRESMTDYDHIIEAVDKFVQKDEANWLYKSNGYNIYHPISFNSSNILKDLYGGKNNVDVCTVVGKNHYNEYSNDGYLIYILMPTTFFVAFINQKPVIDGTASEFKDKLNNDAYGLDFQLKHFPPMFNIIKNVANEYTTLDVILKLEPDPQHHYNICLKAVEKNGEALQYVPLKLKDYNMCITAVSNYGNALSSVPFKLKDYKMCMAAVANSGYALSYVPNNLRDYKMCLTAISNNGYALKYVPEDLRDYNMCLTAVYSTGLALASVPEELRDYKMCATAMSDSGTMWKFVPTDVENYERIITIAVKESPLILFELDPELKEKIKQKLRM